MAKPGAAASRGSLGQRGELHLKQETQEVTDTSTCTACECRTRAAPWAFHSRLHRIFKPARALAALRGVKTMALPPVSSQYLASVTILSGILNRYGHKSLGPSHKSEASGSAASFTSALLSSPAAARTSAGSAAASAAAVWLSLTPRESTHILEPRGFTSPAEPPEGGPHTCEAHRQALPSPGGPCHLVHPGIVQLQAAAPHAGTVPRPGILGQERLGAVEAVLLLPPALARRRFQPCKQRAPHIALPSFGH